VVETSSLLNCRWPSVGCGRECSSWKVAFGQNYWSLSRKRWLRQIGESSNKFRDNLYQTNHKPVLLRRRKRTFKLRNWTCFMRNKNVLELKHLRYCVRVKVQKFFLSFFRLLCSLGILCFFFVKNDGSLIASFCMRKRELKFSRSRARLGVFESTAAKPKKSKANKNR